MDTFLEDDILEQLIDDEINELRSKMEKALVEYKFNDKKDTAYEVMDKLQRLSELKVELKIARMIVRKHLQMGV